MSAFRNIWKPEDLWPGLELRLYNIWPGRRFMAWSKAHGLVDGLWPGRRFMAWSKVHGLVEGGVAPVPGSLDIECSYTTEVDYMVSMQSKACRGCNMVRPHCRCASTVKPGNLE